MAVTTLLPDSSVESVKLAVRSTSTCSNATVLALQTLFRGASKALPDDRSTTKRTARNTKTSTTSTTASRAKSTRGTKASAQETAINTVAEKDAARLSLQERLVLATDVFNTTLKTLSDASKLSTKRDDARMRTAPHSPSSSRVAKKTQVSHETQGLAGLEAGMVAVAECASMALSSLRSLKNEQSGQDDVSLNLQMEQGAGVLAGRYLSLGLNDMAYRELRGLRRRLQQHFDNQATARKSTSNKRIETQEEEITKERMSDLLTFTNIPQSGPQLSLLVSFQSNALRLIASEKKPPTVQKIASSLQLSDPSSPANVIMEAVDSGALPKDKAAIQLQLLSNTVLSLSGAHTTSTTTKDRLKPITSLNLQLLSLEIRCMSWKLSGHICDEGKEMWDPLSRYVANFSYLNKGIEKSEFASVYKTIVRIQGAVANTQKSSTANARDNIMVARIAITLGHLAQEAGCFEEALKLFTETLTPLTSGQSLALATVRCKIACLHLQASQASRSPLTAIATVVSEATSSLSLPLKGSLNDLDELLVEAAKLKKLAMATFGDIATKGKKDGQEVSTRIYQYLPAFLRFLRRYIGRQPSEEQSEEKESFMNRIKACRSIVLSAVDSALAVGKLSITSEQPSWEDNLPALTDCQRLLTAIDVTDEELDSPAIEQIGMTFVRLSNLFWSRYLKEKERGKGYRELVPLVKHSANLLSSCTPEQRNTGFAALKFERLAYLFIEGNLATEAEHAFCQSIQEHIATGILDEMVNSPNFPHRISQDPKGCGFMLGRVISAYLKLKLRNRKSRSQGVFDDESLSLPQRGHILEWQLGALGELHAHAYNDEMFRSHMSALVSTLLDMYTPGTHPVRRLRVILGGLRTSLERPNCLESSMLQGLLQEGLATPYTGHGEDDMLATLTDHLKTSVRLNVGLIRGDLQAEDLSHIVSSWTVMMQHCIDTASLTQYIGDVEHFILQLKAVVDYTEIHGLWKLQLSTLELVLRVTELQDGGDFSEAIIVLSRLVQQYCRLGYCKKAGDLLAQAEQYVSSKNHNISCLATLSHRLAQVSYFLETGDINKASNTLAEARAVYEKNQKRQDLNACSVMSKIAWERLVADAAFMSSQLSFAQGAIKDALFFAKLTVRLNCRIWAKVEKIAQKKQEKSGAAAENSDLDSVVETMAKLDVSQVNPTSTSAYTQGAPFWPHIGSHHTSLLNLASLSAHHGLFQDAIYYGEQALKINKTLNAPARLVNSQAQLGSHWILGGHIPKGQELLSAAETLAKQLESSVELASLQMGLASLYRVQGYHQEELQALMEADKVMTDCLSSEVSEASSVSSGVPELEDGMESLRIRPSSRRAKQPAPTTRRTRATTSTRKATKASTLTAADAAVVDSKSILDLRSDILRQQAACSRSLRDFDNAACLLNAARKYATSRDSQISLNIGESEHFLADAIRHFASHAVYCVLPESTISLPSLQSPSKVSLTGASSKSSTSRKPRAPARSTRSRAQAASEDFAVMLSKAGDSLTNVFSTATTLGSTLDSHTASRLMSRISMLSHATATESPMTWSQPPATVNEIGRIGAFAREHIAISIDKQLADYADPLVWPTPAAMPSESEALCSSTFAKEYIDILPENWNVLSLSLSADRSEFIISRLHQGRSPFLLRLPLKRGNTEDEEEEQFTFEDGREEMQELIKLANESAHAAKAQTDRQSKKDWWRNREELDRRMENLLQNVENVWFGGFRGIFSPLPHDKTSLGRFASMFQNILDKHLPSRQKGGRVEGPRLTLHPNVLELFVGIEDLEDQEDPEETLMDLLYFVVDILQFQGERNAYDEIDFDMMVVETLDAVRVYHESVRNHRDKLSANHTVLVLDKSLHLFPWESLPCLQGFPVCRVPSLECLRDRVLQFQNEHVVSEKGWGIDRRSGTYILNPTGDLQTTQSTFEKDLSRLPEWTGISRREPTEDEFKNGLESTRLFLYFGHGSGAQYIRGRTVKRLDRCAVTFLMGCSSGALTEAGEYEPYGTPMNYLQAGSPALVATLWDVTDKDIDRFAQSTFDQWGLFREVDSGVTLGEAVSRSRSACVLKYLNGAAPVIYGIPSVFLHNV